MNPKDIVASLKLGQVGAANVLIDWLEERGVSWVFPTPNNDPEEGEDCTAFCRWCRTPVSYPKTEKMIKFYTRFTCTSCSPVPGPRLLINNLLGRMSIHLQSDVSSRTGMSQALALQDAPFELLEVVLHVINENA